MKNKKGFTLIELIVVIAILGILALILVPSFNGFIEDTKTQVASSHAKNVVIAFRTADAKLSVSGSPTTGVIYNNINTEEPIIKEMNEIIGDLRGKYFMYYSNKEDNMSFIVTIVHDKTTYTFDCLSGSPVLTNKKQ